MNKLQLHLLAFIFAAFLPSKKNNDHDEEDNINESYYTILGLQSNCKQDEIRKAYKKKSLQYHPDKVAQFARSSHKSPEQIQADFVQIKEAYDILSDVKKRNVYDVLGREGGEIFNAFQGGDSVESTSMDPNALIMNLATASFFNKSKLFVLVLLLVTMVVVGPILICIKADSAFNGNEGSLVDVKWVYILIPIWVFEFLFLVLATISEAWFLILEVTCIIILEVFLALKWDGVLKWDYVLILIPLLLHQGIVLLHSFVTIWRIQIDVARMVTLSYLEEKILPTFHIDDMNVDETEIEVVANESGERRYYNDLTDEEKDVINKLYIIVDNESHEQPSSGTNEDDDPETKLLFDIAKSSEFQYAAYRQKRAKKSILQLVLTRVPFLVLLILQLDLNKGWDWNLVFCTIWIEVCFNTLSNCFICLFTRAMNDPDYRYEIHAQYDTNEDEELGQSDEVISEKSSKVAHATSDVGQFDDTNHINKVEDFNDSIKFAPVSDNPLLTESDMTLNLNEDTDVVGGNEESDGDEINDESRSHDDGYEQTDGYASPFESDSSKRHAQAAGQCFNGIIEIILLALFLVKLNGYEHTGGSSGNYSSIWIIFPLLFFAGLILTCCGCCIYSKVTPDKMEAMMSGRNFPTRGHDDGDVSSPTRQGHGHIQTQNDSNVVLSSDNGDDLD